MPESFVGSRSSRRPNKSPMQLAAEKLSNDELGKRLEKMAKDPRAMDTQARRWFAKEAAYRLNQIDQMVTQTRHLRSLVEEAPLAALDARAPVDQQCLWFALCENPASSLKEHPILGPVPICDRCANHSAIVEGAGRR